MQFSPTILELYAVTDRSNDSMETLYKKTEAALQGGVTLVQLREKNLDEETFVSEAMKIKDLCHRYNVPLIINDNVNVAIKSGADGVHVGIEDTPVSEIRKLAGRNFIIGATAKTIEQAKAAEAAGADYLGVGAVFPSPTKKHVIRITKQQLNDICDAVSIPAVAIGGISIHNLTELTGYGIHGIAVSSALFAADDVKAAAAKLKTTLSKILQPKNKYKSMKTALTIAGSDSSGGAGIQADIKTMTLNGVYAMSAVTALTAQNTTGVAGIQESTPEFLKLQIDAVFEDIRPDAVKIGMVSSAKLIETIAERLCAYNAVNVVIDPVMVSTSGSRLIDKDAVDVLMSKLLPLATLITPNIPEAEVLANIPVKNDKDMITAAEIINNRYGCAVLCKGGHSIHDANDLLYDKGVYKWFTGTRIKNPNTHGTGCTLSSAIASNLAKGYTMEKSVKLAKDYISGALAAMLDLGKGNGPMNHAFYLTDIFSDKI